MNNGLPQRRPYPSPPTCEDVTVQGTCRSDEIKALEMKRLSWIIQMGPVKMTRVFVRRQEGQVKEEGDVMTKAEVGVIRCKERTGSQGM